MEVVLDGTTLTSVEDVHRVLAAALDFGPYYGANLPALWDRLSADVPRPVAIRWVNSDVSRRRLGKHFEAVVTLFADVERQDADAGLIERFSYRLE